MKKFILCLLFLLGLAGAGYYMYTNRVKKLIVEETAIDIDNIFIYGTHLNFSGKLIQDENLDIVLYNGKFNSYEINVSDDSFNLSKYVNDGIYLESIPVGKYYIFLRSKSIDEIGKTNYKYYVLKNTTKYDKMTYYTFTKRGLKIVINTDSEYNTLTINVSKNNDEQVYDIVLDPGHGGIDSGASKNGYNESDITMKIANNLKEKLEDIGFSVKLTHEDKQLSNNEKLNDYGVHGRAVIPHEVNAKYVFSIHLNSSYYSYVNGIELYAPDNIDYSFINNMAKNLHDSANVNYSTNKINKMSDGVYTRVFTESDIISAKKDFVQRKMIPYDITTKSNYYFMIREPGSIITGAYVDDRNEKNGNNPYYNSNIGVEAYLLELGYLSNRNDVTNIINNMDKYTEAIAITCKNYLYLK